MIELHGWLTVREAYKEEKESEQMLSAALASIEATLEKSPTSNLFCRMLTQNGASNLVINGNFNHKDSRWDYIIDLLELVSKVAEGSYGVLHFHDDEDTSGHENHFQAIVLKKGRIKKMVDKNLSPYSSMLEDYSSEV